MDIKEVVSWCVEHWAITAFALSLFVQFTPIIKFNPFTALFTWLGRLITANVAEEINEIKKSLAAQQEAIDENEKDRIRFEVLDFANSLRNERKHTKDEFEHVIVLNQKYHRLLERTGDSNGVFNEEYEYIRKIYHKCQEENSFL